jgi:hypothetical protein
LSDSRVEFAKSSKSFDRIVYLWVCEESLPFFSQRFFKDRFLEAALVLSTVSGPK